MNWFQRTVRIISTFNITTNESKVIADTVNNNARVLEECVRQVDFLNERLCSFEAMVRERIRLNDIERRKDEGDKRG